MSRFTNNDWEDELAYGRWQGRRKAVLNGRPAQTHFRELEAALLALPEKQLIASAICDESGAVCALGAVAVYRGMPRDALHEEWLNYEEEQGSEWGAAYFGQDKFGMTGTLAWIIAEQNDEGFGQRSPEGRYEAMLEWVRDRIRP